MKIYLDNVNLFSQSGPNNFAKRLAKGLFEKGHDVLLDKLNDYDVSISFISRLNVRNDKPNILRIDGIWFKEEEIKRGLNNPLLYSYQKADAVIVQSKFDSEMITKWFGFKKHHIIRNGIDTQEPYLINVSDALINLRNTYKHIFVSSSNWHGQKRLKENIRIFRSISLQLDSCCLIVIGNSDVMFSGSNIFYTGSIKNDECYQIFSISDWMIHSAWLDHCPNVVLDALSTRTPVICTNSGGTHEILRGKRDVNDIGPGKNGIVIPDVVYNYEPMNYDDPPSIPQSSIDVILDSLSIISSKNVEIDTSTFDIQKCIDNYINVIESVVYSSK